jgi:hypothetical protein
MRSITSAVSRVYSDAAKAADTVDDVSDAAKAADTVDDVGDAAKAADTVDDVSDAAKAADSMADSIDDLLSDKTFTNDTGKVQNYTSNTLGDAAAQADFDSLDLSNVRTYKNGAIVGDLPDGRVANLHPSSSMGGTPTLEIYDPISGNSIKIRY